LNIPNNKLLEMYARLGHDYYPDATKERLHRILTFWGPSRLKGKRMKEMWKPERPTINYCYVVTEYAYWSFHNYGFPAKCWDRNPRFSVHTTKIPSLPGITHWFLREISTGGVIDLTADQFENWEEIDYDNSRKTFFLQTGCKGPSFRALDLMYDMGTYRPL